MVRTRPVIASSCVSSRRVVQRRPLTSSNAKVMFARTGMERSNSSWRPMTSIVSRLSTIVRRHPLKLVVFPISQSRILRRCNIHRSLTCSRTRCSPASARRSTPHTPSTRHTRAGTLPSPHERAPTTSSSDADLEVEGGGKGMGEDARRDVGSAGVRRGTGSRNPSQRGIGYGRGRQSA